MNTTVLVVKNLPDPCTNLEEIFSAHQPTSVKRFGRRRALLTFADPQYAFFVLHKLHQTEIGGRIIAVEYHRVGNEYNEPGRSTEKETIPSIPTIVKKLYATCDNLRYEQPPPPYLKYSYPKINPDILDSISIALMSNSRFYTQVLHLMNRMNLDPPFGAKKPEGYPLKEKFREAAVQTDPVAFPSDVESEWESDSEKKGNPRPTNRKRKLPDNDHLFKHKAKKILHVTTQLRKKPGNQTKEDLCNVFEIKKPLIEQKIALRVDNVKLPDSTADKQDEPTPQVVAYVPPEDLKSNRIPANQLNDLPVFKNYNKGEPSNKLYIKNLPKDVTENDLHKIYARFHPTLEVKVMQQGRMKGQAFVTFANLPDDGQYVLVQQALNETNGFILKTKPMVVSFGKK